jgi:muramoyltetrapeptide carboxypeptidase LdcA involved in peptidoglycan recycling
VVGGEDQITVIPHLDPALALRDPKPFLGTSDNTNLHHWLWSLGIGSFYGGSTQVHLGPGPGVDEIHARSLVAALIDGGTLEITDPGESEDIGLDWQDPRAFRHGS